MEPEEEGKREELLADIKEMRDGYVPESEVKKAKSLKLDAEGAEVARKALQLFGAKKPSATIAGGDFERA